MAISSRYARTAIRRLLPVVQGLLEEKHVSEHLKRSKRNGRALLKRKDFVWYEILLSLSTWGNSGGAKRLDFDALSYDRLSGLSESRRRDLIKKKFVAAGLRYPEKKAKYLQYNFTLVRDKGGLHQAKHDLMVTKGRDNKIKVLREYKGIGEKYAHNIMMDAYHSDFHDSIAVDQRIKRISRELGLAMKTYADSLFFYRQVAAKANIQPWELDRILYKYKDEVVRRISSAEKAA